MRDDQRPDRDQRRDELRERFDEALDELFGVEPDAEPGGQTPPPPAVEEPSRQGEPERTPVPHPAQLSEPEPTHEPHPPHQIDERHVLGPGNVPPPPSYGMPTRSASPPPEQAEPPTMVAGEPAHEPVSQQQAAIRPGRNWRRIGCYTCLVLVGVPTFCLGVLLVIGLIVGDEVATPTPAAQVEGLQPVEVDGAGDAPALDEPYASISADRPSGVLFINDEGPFGSLESPVPLGYAAPLGDGWTLQIDAVTENANELIVAENMFNVPPAEGRQFLIARVTATNSTGTPAVFDARYRLRLVGGATGTVYTAFAINDHCGVIPDPFPDDLIPSGSRASGNVCWQVWTEDLPSLLLFNESYSELDLDVWFAVTGGGTQAGSAP